MRQPKTLQAGETLPLRTIGPITQTDIVRFAGAGGDFNPLHHDPEYARAAGLAGVIAMGQMHAGMLAAWLCDLVHVEHLLSYQVRFASPLALGETIQFTGRVENITPGENGTATASLALQGAVGDRVVVTATARVRTAG
ncbi:hypothetical protein MHAS_04057 [Mycolicibacterium hassiacum DSM 44199]|jgi:Acyl dehydratase|uniref:MaoC family dehydratase n=1 Tax=Mycolicibacterium TaxID=1866885 RepID=UPI00025AE205|nr:MULTISPECIES: MaoC/PaaZ C-terminal domain-containing protein [Mycolicibacterium]PZN23308.1 MAG: acyl dehydratase [Mycolicibacterium hassiacum]EID10466.1 MaoC domain-containing protein dehydratase [Mycolicibacterium phlei RIVM601174]MBF4194766.1 MaoC domain-containing protein dehydratase [Mycolicibacterium phlei]MDA4087359.1 acyl dehydratase [Mycolicibacterium hassiacum DSM 44199]VCT92330.1 hypothetical protein MHAS_04057 [Mycolicibacterium hassiacum DSM 44199]